ncbi:hypothetical protein PM082_004079 [Marasmius tenuissimus]|nr:hypothetical protein PM082_004079 [Marasmius tenuissimus]
MRKGKAPAREAPTFEPGPSRIPTHTGSTVAGTSSRQNSQSAISSPTMNPSSSSDDILGDPQSISVTMVPGQTLVDPLPSDDSPVAPAAGIFSGPAAESEAGTLLFPSTDPSLFGQPSSSSHGFRSELDRSWKDPTRKKWLRAKRSSSSDGPIYSTPVNKFTATPSSESSHNTFLSNPFGDSHTPSVQRMSSQEESTPRATPSRLPDAPEWVSETPSTSATFEESMGEFYNRISRMYVLQLVRNRDLSQFSTTNIPEQPVTIDRHQFYSNEHPRIRMATFDLSPEDLREVRRQFVEPFGPDDHVRRGMGNTRSTPEKGDSRDPREPDDSPNDDNEFGDGSRPPPKRGPPKEPRKDRNPLNMGGGPPGPPGPPDGGDSNGEHTESDPDRTDSEDDDEYPDGNHPGRRGKQFKRFASSLEAHLPTVFGQTRYTSADATFSAKEVFVYDPKPRAEAELLRAAFQRFEDLIIYQLLGAKVSEKTTSGLRKNLLQSIPKPDFYHGDNNDYVTFDEWVRSLVRWLALAGLVGPERRWSKSLNDWVLTSIDLQRTNIVGTLLKGSGAIWFSDYVEATPDSFDRSAPYLARMSFMEVISGLYRRFIHDASLSHVGEKLKDVRYSASGGVKGVFSAMVRYAKCMPSPPDPYTFKQQLLLKLPESMSDDMTSIHGVSAKASTVDVIMQAALTCERGLNAKKYLSRLKEGNKRAHRRCSRSKSHDKKKKEKGHSPSPKRLQKVEGRRYQVDAYQKDRNDRYPPRNEQRYPPKNGNRYPPRDNRYPNRENDRNATGSKPNDMPQSNPKLSNQYYRKVDANGKPGGRLYHMVEVSDEESDSKSNTSEPADEVLAAMGSNTGSDNDSDDESDPWGGSQYSSRGTSWIHERQKL